MNELTQFHFLRPAWFLLLLPAGWLLFSIIRRGDSRSAFKGIIDPHLLDHLVTQAADQPSRFRPLTLLASIILIGTAALAGPAWQREAAPFTEDQAAVAIVLKVTPDMLAEDIQPSRLQRAVFKIKDLLELRPGTRNALIAYAGSPHLVVPLTSDSKIIESFAAELSPDLMPESGDEPAKAIALANTVLTQSGLPSSIVLITDDIDSSQLPALESEHTMGGIDILLFAVAAGPEVIPPLDSPPAAPLNLEHMRAAADALDGSLTVVSVDDSDVKQLNSDIKRSFANAELQEGSRWKDAGYYLLPLLLLLLLPFFRQGGSVSLGGRQGAG